MNFAKVLIGQIDDYADNPDCRDILMNCIKNLEKEAKAIRNSVNQNRQTQIKGEQSLADFAQSVTFITDMFDKYEEERERKKKIIKELNDEVSAPT